MSRYPSFADAAASALLAVVCGAAVPAEARQVAADSARPVVAPLRTISFETAEGTWTSLDVSPDGRMLVFDLLGDLYTLPIEGGTARPLTSGLDWDQQPRYSPDGRHIAFLSDRDGGTNVWIIDADGGSPRQLSRDRRSSFVSPAWTTDGPAVVVRRSTWGTTPTTDLWVYHRDGGSGHRLAEAGKLTPAGGASFSRDGRYAYHTGARQAIFRYDRRTGENVQLTAGFGASLRPAVSPDGRWLAYGRSADARTELRLRDLETGEERVLAPNVTGGANQRAQDAMPGYAFTPDGRALVLSIDGRIQRIDIASGGTTVIPFVVQVERQVAEPVQVARRVAPDSVVARVIRWPRVSPDGRRLVFSSFARLWIMDLPAGQPRLLTPGGATEYAPAWSPDGRWIAYTTWSDSAGGGHLRVIGADGRGGRQLTTRTGQYLNPAWSPDGSRIAYVAGSPLAEQIAWQPNEELPYQIRWVSASGGESHHVTHVRPYHWSQRAHPILSFTAGGTRLLYPELEDGRGGRHAIVSISLDGLQRTVLYRLWAGDEAIPSPDGTRLALWRSENFYVVPLPQYAAEPIDLDLGAAAVPSTRITRDGADWGAWSDASSFVYASANRVFRRTIGPPGTPIDTASVAEPIADVRLVLPRARPAGAIAFTNARIITMRADEVIEDGTIVVRGDRIVAVGPAGAVTVPGDAVRVNATGRTIMPGLHDAHAHLQFSSQGTYPDRKWPFIMNLAYGVTSVLDPWTPTHEFFEQSDMIDAGLMLGPRLYSTGSWVDGRFEYLAQYVDIRGIDDARQIVRRLRAFGADMMKEYVQPRRDQRQWLVQAAREEGLPITAEGAGDLVRNLTMVVDGFTAFEHTVPLSPLHGDVIELMARSGVHYTPTLIVTYGGVSLFDYFTALTNPHDDPKVRRFTPEPRLDDGRRWRHTPEDELHFRGIARDALRISRAGGRISLGSHGNQQGIGAHWELWGHVEGGATTLEAIRYATLRPAEKIGLERDLGSLEPGKLADFLVLAANPLDDIRRTTAIDWVVQGGFVYDADSMTRVWPDYQPLQRFFWQTDEEWRRFAAPAAAPLR
jgi:Tol biopolymer transport system component/imidazolonepropionase-like amidohydrolase